MSAWGAVMMSFFGGVFAAVTMHWQWQSSGVMLALPFLIFAIIGLSAAYVIRLPGKGIVPSERAERAIMWSSIAEGIGLFLASNIVINLHRMDLLLPAMALVVGTNGFNEFDATVQKGIRLPGKGRLDRAAGQLGIAVAENRSEDTRHQAGLNLSGLWHDWLLATALLRNDVFAIANYGTALHSVQRREALRDASKLDVDQALSALALAEAQAAQSKMLIERARLTLQASFPTVVLPSEAPVLSDPELPPEPIATLHDLVVLRSHEIGAARKEADRLFTLAQRARLDRYADPIVGVRMFSERDGQEKGIGLVASIGFGGAYRRATAGQASSEANAAAIDLTQMQRTIAIVANTDVSDALTRLESWRANRRAVDAASSAAARTASGYRLGAIDLNDLLYAQRQANEARRAEINARAEAARAIFKLRIDSHTVWAPLGEAE